MTINKTYVNALAQLVNALNFRDIDFEVSYNDFHNGFVVKFKEGWDVAINNLTGGSEIGLFESYGHPDDNGDVTKYMTVDAIMKRFSVSFEDILLHRI